jgi:hypothetical protein
VLLQDRPFARKAPAAVVRAVRLYYLSGRRFP